MNITISASKPTVWAARLALILVFIVNVQCALAFIVWPQAFAPAYELSGVAGSAAVQGLGVAFLMWNATYLLAIVNPDRFSVVFALVLAQQIIGLIGESMIYLSIPDGHELLAASILRFIAVDGAGLFLLSITFGALLVSRKRKRTALKPSAI